MKEKIIEKDNYNIHLIKTNKFRENVIRIFFRRKLDNNFNKISSALKMLKYGNKYFKDKREIFLKLEDLYITSFDSYCSVYGDLNCFCINLEYINPKYVKEDINHNIIKFLFDFLNNPLYQEKYIEDYKREKNVEYNDLMKNPNYIANERSDEIYYDKYKYKNMILDKYIIDDINKLTIKDLNDGYNLLMNDTYIDIFLAGNFKDEDIKDIELNNIFNNNLKGYIDYRSDYEPSVNNIKEKGESSESKIFIKYYLNGDNKVRICTKIFNYIFGGSSSGKLFNNLRNKNSLCYGIYSNYCSYENYLTVSTSVSDVCKSLKLIDETFEEMKDISIDDFNTAIKFFNEEHKNVFSNPNSAIAFCFSIDCIYGISVNEYLDYYKNITLDDIKSIHNLLVKKVTYVLEGSNSND